MHNQNDLSVLRHSAAHLLAHAVIELFPDTLLTIGPATQDGFFYDCLSSHSFKEEDLSIIEKRMHEISQRNLPIIHTQIPKEEGRKIFKSNPFKMELIDGIPDDTVGLAKQGDFIDLCRGGHVASTGDITYFKLLTVSGSYWRADKNNAALQRIAGTAFFTQEALDQFLTSREEALKYDHRRIGKELDLFSFQEEGAGFPFYHPHGKTIINVLTNYMRNLIGEYGYQEISTPIMLSESLWKQSGHYEHYKENMYFCCMEQRSYAVKPMNCPGAILVYRNRPRSYRELPLRLSEFGLVHRYELSGVLHGLFRVRAFTQDDGHIFCSMDQVEKEVVATIECIKKTCNRFDFKEITIYLSTKPKNALGDDIFWQKATDALTLALKHAGCDYTIQEGEGAFYGPKIEFHIKDSLNRSWQCGTVQLDPFLPQNFDLSFINSQGLKERPVMIHRAIYGSMERFFGMILEHYKGHLPVWLAPVQVTLLTITDEQLAYATDLLTQLKSDAIRATIDTSSDPLSGKIKTAQLQRIPLMIVIGKKEVANNTISIRYANGSQKTDLSIHDLIAEIKNA